MLPLPDGLHARVPELGDAPGVLELVHACEFAVHGEADLALADLIGTWRRPSFELARDAVLVLDGERIVAEAEVFKGRRAEVAVHPDARGRGIGSALASWTEDRAREMGSALVGQTLPDADPDAVSLLERRDYEPMWTSWVLAIRLDGASAAEPALPDGFAFRSYRLATDDREVFDVVERAFAEWPDREPSTFEDWRAETLHVDGFDPSLSFVIERNGAIVGAAQGLLDGTDEGWVQYLAVAREQRGKGLGGALLRRAFAAFAERGRTSAGLSTDSRTGALGLYEHVGMRVTRSYRHHARRP